MPGKANDQSEILRFAQNDSRRVTSGYKRRHRVWPSRLFACHSERSEESRSGFARFSDIRIATHSPARFIDPPARVESHPGVNRLLSLWLFMYCFSSALPSVYWLTSIRRPPRP